MTHWRVFEKCFYRQNRNTTWLNLLDAAAPYLSDDFVTTQFDFYGKTMSGKQEQQPRWKRSLSTVNGALGEAVGQMYGAKYFPGLLRRKRC